MKQDNNNNEMDLLLRSLATAGPGQSPLEFGEASRRDDGGLSEHLDADELNSFAEGALPAPAHARYVAHLADCGDCRSIVISLSRTTGAASRTENLEQRTESGFWQKLITLFSPPVLRYAVPAIALTAVIAVSFFALRQRPGQDFVAQNQKTTVPPAVSVSEQPSGSPLSGTRAEAEVNNPANTGAELDATRDKKLVQPEKSGEALAPIQTTDLDSPTVSSLKDAAPSKQGAVGGVSRPVFAPEPQATAPPPPPKPSTGTDKTDEVQKEEVTRREVNNLPVEAERNQPRDRNEDGRHGPSRSNNATLSAAKRADGMMTEGGETKAKARKASDDEAETRTVSGKRFRREGNAWIDGAYDSSRRTINVSRGSEQFRVLVADEPGIRTIAERLSGVVIVVWNGRAYRIQ